MNIKLKYRVKILLTLSLTAMMICINVGDINANGLALDSKSAILINADTGEVLYEKDAYTQRQIASVSKVMTALLVIEEGNLDTPITVTAESTRVKGTSFKLKTGMIISKRDLLYGLLYISGNDAGDALARSSSLGYEGFINKMNEKASQLGLGNTKFFDPHGLGSYNIAGSGNNYSTAHDLAILLKVAMSNSEFAAIKKAGSVATGNPSFPNLENNNNFMKEYNGALGSKTGYTGNAGNCLVAMANRDGVNLIGVILNAPKGKRDKEIYALMDYGFGVPNEYNYTQTPAPTTEAPTTVAPTDDSILLDLLG